MRFISESSALINHKLAYDTLIAATQLDTNSFPIVHGQASDTKNTFSIKSSATQHLAGLKVGSFWEDNPKNGFPWHNTLILLFNQANGKWQQPSKQVKAMHSVQQLLMQLNPNIGKKRLKNISHI